MKIKKNTQLRILFTIILLILVILFHLYRNQNILSNINLNNPSEPFLIFYFNSKSNQSEEFIKLVLEYVNQQQLRLNIGLVSPNWNDLVFNGNYKIYEKKDLDRLNLDINSYQLIDKAGEKIKSGILSFSHKPLLNEIDNIYGISKNFAISDYFKTNESLRKLPQLAFIKNDYLFKKNTCFIFYEEMCFGCSSGNDLIIFNKLISLYPTHNFYFITMHNYSVKDIRRFKMNHNLDVEIIVSDIEGRKWWDNIKNKYNTRHPLLGTILVVNSNKIIVEATKSWDMFKRWLEDFNE